MPVPLTARGQRKHIIRRQIHQSQTQVREILITSKARVDSAILNAARDSRFGTSARVRDRLYGDIQGLYEDMGGDLAQWNNRMTSSTMREWHSLGIKDLPSGAGDSFTRFSQQHFDDYLSYVNPLGAESMTAVNSLASSDVRWLRQQFVETFRDAQIQGLNMREMSKTLQSRVLDPRPNWKFVDTSGRAWQPDNYFNMLTRTNVANISRQSYLDTASDAGNDLFLLEGGVPTAPPPDPCWEWYGRIVSLTGNTEGYPTLAEAEAEGMFHPNCVHYPAVVLDGEIPEATLKQEHADDSRGDAAEAATEADEESKRRQAA